MSVLSGRGLVMLRRGRRAVDGVDITLQPGEFLGLLGPNAAGKTTLLRMLCGLLKPTEGQVLWDAKPLDRLHRRQRAQALAYLAQAPDCHWDLDVAQVVALGRLPHRGPFRGVAEQDRQAVTRALADCELEALAERPIHTLSGGEQRRVFLARALAGEPQVLLADEPVTGLDPSHQLDVMLRLQAVARGGAAVVAVMHDLALSARFCDRLLLLGEGKVQGEGAPEQVLSDDLLARVYGVRVVRVTVGDRRLPVVAGMSLSEAQDSEYPRD